MTVGFTTDTRFSQQRDNGRAVAPALLSRTPWPSGLSQMSRRARPYWTTR